MDNNTKVSLIYLAGGLVVLVLSIFSYLYLKENTGKKIKENLGYAIGSFQSAITGGPITNTNIFFSFETSDFTKMDRVFTKGKITGYKNAQEGDKYLVIYDTTAPENCQILFDYPINDSTDFKRYLEEFKTKPLDISKYF
jgi:hypothetical protein